MPESHIKSGSQGIPERCKEPVLDNSKLKKNIYLSELGGMYQTAQKWLPRIPERCKESV